MIGDKAMTAGGEKDANSGGASASAADCEHENVIASPPLLFLSPRWLFLCMFSFFAFTGRFMSLFYAANGISDESIGLLFAISAVVGAVAAPAVTRVVDSGSAETIGRRRLLACFASILMYTTSVAMHWVNIESDASRLIYFVALRIIMSVALAPVSPIIDAICIARLGPGNERFYGRERLWGAVSWGISSLALGIFLDWFPGSQLPVLFGTIGASIPFTAVVYAFAAKTPPSKHRVLKAKSSDAVDGNVRPSPSSGSIVKDLCCAQEGDSSGGMPLLFFMCLFCLSVGMSLVEQLVFLFFEEELKASNILCGISVCVTVSFEIPLFFFAPRIQRRMRIVSLMVSACWAYSLRVLVYAITPATVKWSILAGTLKPFVTFLLPRLFIFCIIFSVQSSRFTG